MFIVGVDREEHYSKKVSRRDQTPPEANKCMTEPSPSRPHADDILTVSEYQPQTKRKKNMKVFGIRAINGGLTRTQWLHLATGMQCAKFHQDLTQTVSLATDTRPGMSVRSEPCTEGYWQHYIPRLYRPRLKKQNKKHCFSLAEALMWSITWGVLTSGHVGTRLLNHINSGGFDYIAPT